MNAMKRALLLVGSPRLRSSSEALGRYLLEHLGASWETEAFHIRPLQSAGHRRDELLRSVRAADLLILSFPLYVDSLPAAAIRALEWIAEDRLASAATWAQRFVAICNCGFPETRHTETALAICRRFAKESDIEWAGGLGLGGGGAVNGRPIEKTGGMMSSARAALDLAAQALAAGKPVPDEAVALMAKPPMPPWLYAVAGGLTWWAMAKPHGTQWRLGARPYEKSR